MQCIEVTEQIPEVTTKGTNKILEAVEGTLKHQPKHPRQPEVEHHIRALTGAHSKYKEEVLSGAITIEVLKIIVEAKIRQNQTETSADIAKSRDT